MCPLAHPSPSNPQTQIRTKHKRTVHHLEALAVDIIHLERRTPARRRERGRHARDELRGRRGLVRIVSVPDFEFVHVAVAEEEPRGGDGSRVPSEDLCEIVALMVVC
jgi:hypothetical protein